MQHNGRCTRRSQPRDTAACRSDFLARMIAEASGRPDQSAAIRASAEQTHQKRCAGANAPPTDFDGTCNVEEEVWHNGRWHRKHRRARRIQRKIIAFLIAALLLLLTLLFFWPRVKAALSGALTPTLNISVPDSLDGFLPDESLGYNAFDFSDAILGESRERQELVVMEQDVEVTTKISQALLHIALFSKAKTIRSYGTGVYTVNLANLSPKDISVDMDTRIVTVTIPHSQLQYVDIDVQKTTFEDTKKALFAIGDIKLTQEEQQLLDKAIDEALYTKLNTPALFIKADETALLKVRDVFLPLVSAISEDFLMKIVMLAEPAAPGEIA
ncbi:MAG: DUF4230 domain-containing protein [Clostridia bacterium]